MTRTASGEAIMARGQKIASELLQESDGEAVATAVCILAEVLIYVSPPGQSLLMLPRLNTEILGYLQVRI